MKADTFDVRARLSNPPDGILPTWLVVCRACGWHCEVEEGASWRGCPDCGAPLWAYWPDELAREPIPVTAWHESFAPKRRRNAWRTAKPLVSEARG